MSLRSKCAMLKRWLYILTGHSVTAVRQGVGAYYARNSIRGYYNDLRGKVSPNTLLDDEGLPVTRIASGERVRFPIVIFQYGLALYDKYLETKDRRFEDAFRGIAEWASRSQRGNGSWDAFGPVQSRKYSVSSMCQGEGASLLFRAGLAFGEARYTQAAFRAVDFMLTPIENGGTAVDEGSNLFLEEYPQTPRRSVLNGWIFSIFGLYDAALLQPEKYSDQLKKTVHTLREALPAYDAGYWSLYDVRGKIASPAYHSLHIALLTVLSDITGVPEFQQYAKRFDAYENRRANQMRAIIKKLFQKLFEKSDVITIQ